MISGAITWRNISARSTGSESARAVSGPANRPMASAPINEGHFARKQLFSRSGLIRWSHRRRFEAAIAKSVGFGGCRVLDIGCGDATYFLMLFETPDAPAEAVGAEIDPRVVRSNRERFAAYPALSFIDQSDLHESRWKEYFDAVVCTEVFEHLCDPDGYLDLIRSVLRPGGRLVVSVPIETGLTIVLKQGVRRVAGWRRIGEYQYTLSYSWGELVRSVFAGRGQHIPRVTHHTLEGMPFHCHKGFNWRTLQDRIAQRFILDRVSFSPVTWLPAALNSQAWFEAHKPTSG